VVSMSGYGNESSNFHKRGGEIMRALHDRLLVCQEGYCAIEVVRMRNIIIIMNTE
jgi:hypothetical protein